MENKKNLIDAVRFREILEKYLNAPHVTMSNYCSKGMRLAIESCMEILDAQPKVDAVEVVRCKDCKYQKKVWRIDNRLRGNGRYLYCCELIDDHFVSNPVCGGNNQFCSNGERKDE